MESDFVHKNFGNAGKVVKSAIFRFYDSSDNVSCSQAESLSESDYLIYPRPQNFKVNLLKRQFSSLRLSKKAYDSL